MKSIKYVMFPLLLLSLVSCTLPSINIGGSSFSSSDSSSSISSGKEESSAVSSSSGGSSGSDGSSSSSSAEFPDYVTVYSINDVHGSMPESQKKGELGVAKLSYAIKHDADYNPETSLILSAGDSWQGGYLSYKEKPLTDQLLSYLGVEAMAIGNHEFDWGVDQIKSLSESSPFPLLGCNIRDSSGNQADFCKPSAVIQKGAVKYGVIGAIGSGEESSIASGILGSYSFSGNIDLIKNEAKSLTDEGCDIVVVLLHDASDSSYTLSIANTLSLADNNISGIFGGHSHMFQSLNIGSNNMPYVQGGSNTRGYCKMKFSTHTGGLIKKAYVQSNSSDFAVSDDKLDQNILDTIQTKETQYQADETLGTLDYKMTKYDDDWTACNFVATGMNEAVLHYGYKSTRPLLAIHNMAGIRDSLYPGNVTITDLFKVSPFDNKLKLFKDVRGSVVSNLIGTQTSDHSSKYYAFSTSDSLAFETSKYYDLVVIDFVYNSSYFPSSLQNATQYDCGKDGSLLYIRDALKDYMSFGGRDGGNAFYKEDFACVAA